jgi:hypothetical protein
VSPLLILRFGVTGLGRGLEATMFFRDEAYWTFVFLYPKELSTSLESLIMGVKIEDGCSLQIIVTSGVVNIVLESKSNVRSF